MQLNFADGLEPYFAANRVIADADGSARAEFTASGETWSATLYYQDSGVVHPGSYLPTGTSFEFDTVREFRIQIRRHSEEDAVGEQKMNAHLRPRWQGMQVERNDGSRQQLQIPDSIREGVNVRLSGSNVDIFRYQSLLRSAALALDLNPSHFRDPHDSSTVQDAARYVRVHKDASGPVHARDGPIAQLSHLLEDDRSGYRKVVQNDSNDHGEKQPGYYHTVTLGPERVREAFPSHSAPVEVKHYYARESHSQPEDSPLRHPKVEVAYQVSRWDGSVGVGRDDLEELQRDLDRTLHAVLREAGIEHTPGAGGGPFVPDAYFSAEIGEHEQPPDLNLTRIRNEQESIVVRTLSKVGGFSPVEHETLETLVTDGGRVSPLDVAEEHGRHVGSVRRAIRRMEEIFSREYGEVSLRSPYVAELVQDAVEQYRNASETLAEITGQALLDAERGVESAASALRAWCAKNGVEVDSRGEAIEAIRLGEVQRAGRDGLANVRAELRRGLSAWLDTGRDREEFVAGTAFWSSEKRGRRSLDVAMLLPG